MNCLISGTLSLTVTAPSEINVSIRSDSPIVLNCTYILDIYETIDVLYIKKKTSSGSYNELAKFTAQSTLYAPHGDYLRERSDIYGFNTGSSSAALVINDVKCEDDGQYQCYVDYVNKNTAFIHVKNTIVYIHGNNIVKIRMH